MRGGRLSGQARDVRRKPLSSWRDLKEGGLRLFFAATGVLAILVLLGIFSLLFTESLPALKTLGVGEFFFRLRWDPTSPEQPSYGLLAMIVSTLMVSIGALALAVPVGVACAAFLAEGAPPQLREFLKPAVEILASIPSVVVGFLGVALVGPFIARLFRIPSGLCALNGALLLAVMALPTIVSICEDAIISVPQEFKSASLALGATKWQTLVHVTLPSASSGIIAAVMLGMGRAIGETMTVLMATGNAAALPHGFLDPVRTMTATIAIEMGETVQGSLHYQSLFVIGLVLFCMTFAVNVVSDLVLERFQRVRR